MSKKTESALARPLVRMGFTLDTGALVALEKRDRRMRLFLEQAKEYGWQVTVPNAVLVEWWRPEMPPPAAREVANWGNHVSTGKQQRVLDAMIVEPLSEHLAKVAGMAAGEVGATAVDAIVMASAAQRGDAVYTSDLPDLQKLQQFFPNVRLFRA